MKLLSNYYKTILLSSIGHLDAGDVIFLFPVCVTYDLETPV